MKVEVNLEKKYFFAFLLAGLLLIGAAGVVAYYSDDADPSVMGHSVDEMDWEGAINSNVTAAGYCLGNETTKSCIQSWPSSGGGASETLLAGSGIVISTVSGGKMINATASGGSSSISLESCTEHDFDVGFGVSGAADSRDYFCPAGKVLRGVRLYYWTWTGGNAPEGTYISKLYCCSLTGGGSGSATSGDIGTPEVVVKKSAEGGSPSVCCDAGWVRTGCGESGDSNAYSYPDTVNPLCCKSWFGGDENVYATCLRIV